MAGKRKATATPASQPTKARRTNVNRIDRTKDLKLSRSAETFQLYAGEEIARDDIADDGSVIVGRLYQYDLMNDWKTFLVLCNSVEEWYNEQRQYYSPDDMDRVCRAINFCWKDKRSVCYESRDSSPIQLPDLSAVTTTGDTSDILRRKHATIGKKLRDAFAIFDTSPFAKGNAPKAVKARVLMRIQADYNELLRQILYQLGVTPADVERREELSLISKKEGQVHRTLKEQDVPYERLMDGMWWHNTSDGMWVTDSFEAPTVPTDSDEADGQATTLLEVTGMDDPQIKMEEASDLDGATYGSSTLTNREESAPKAGIQEARENDSSTSFAPSGARPAAQQELARASSAPATEDFRYRTAFKQRISQADGRSLASSGADVTHEMSSFRVSSAQSSERATAKNRIIRRMSAPDATRFGDMERSRMHFSGAGTGNSSASSTALPKASASAPTNMNQIQYPTELRPYLPNRDDATKAWSTKSYRGMHTSEMMKKYPPMFRQAIDTTTKMWKAANNGRPPDPKFKKEVNRIMIVVFIALFEKMLAETPSTFTARTGALSSSEAYPSAPNGSNQDTLLAREADIARSNSAPSPSIHDAFVPANGNIDVHPSAPHKENDAANKISTSDVSDESLPSKLNNSGDSFTPNGVQVEDDETQKVRLSEPPSESYGAETMDVSSDEAPASQLHSGLSEGSQGTVGGTEGVATALRGSEEEVKDQADNAHKQVLSSDSAPDGCQEATREDVFREYLAPNGSQKEAQANSIGGHPAPNSGPDEIQEDGIGDHPAPNGSQKKMDEDSIREHLAPSGSHEEAQEDSVGGHPAPSGSQKDAQESSIGGHPAPNDSSDAVDSAPDGSTTESSTDINNVKRDKSAQSSATTLKSEDDESSSSSFAREADRYVAHAQEDNSPQILAPDGRSEEVGPAPKEPEGVADGDIERDSDDIFDAPNELGSDGDDEHDTVAEESTDGEDDFL